MDTDSSRFWDVFFAVYEGLPRQGPGNRAYAEKALALCTALPASPAVLDIGCGAGTQTLYLAECTGGEILAIDTHAPFIEKISATVEAHGLSHRVKARVQDMAHVTCLSQSFDLVWSEGALYNIGIEKALHLCKEMLRPGGYLVFTDAVWRKDNPPDEIKKAFLSDYPTMGRVEDVCALIEKSGLNLCAHFTLPDQAWWEDFYTPMIARIEELRSVYAHDAEACAILDEIALEPVVHRRYCAYYAYEFFVTQRPLI